MMKVYLGWADGCVSVRDAEKYGNPKVLKSISDFVKPVIIECDQGYSCYEPPYDHFVKDIWSTSKWVTFEVENLQEWLCNLEHRIILENRDGDLYITIYNGYVE